MPRPNQRTLTAFLILASFTATAGQMYRWVDERGVVHYSDQPPPPRARNAETIKPRANVVEADKEVYELRRARELNPVVLFVTECGEPCDLARDFLAQRKIPYDRTSPSARFHTTAKTRSPCRRMPSSSSGSSAAWKCRC